MSGQESSYRPQGNGPHPTMAGNMFDPKVEADGMKGGLGVGGTSENTIKAEGAEHVAQHGLGHSGIGQTGMDATTTHGHGHHHGHQGQGGMTGGQSGLGQGQSGLGQGQSGLGQGQSGLGQGQSYDSGSYGSSGSHAQNLEGAGSTIGAGEPSAAETHGSGIDYLKSHSGAGRSGSGMEGAGLGSSAGGMAAGGMAAGGMAGTEAGRYGNSGTSTGAYDNTSTGGYSDSRTGMSGSGYDNSSNDPSTRQSGGNTTTDASLAAREITGAGDEDLGTGRGGARDSNPRTSGAPVDESSSRPMGKDHISGTTGKEQSSVAAAADSSDGRGGPPPSIPTAGGERIGTKHWGESKIIPDNPPRRPSEGGAGVSSSAGQSDDATKHNTHANSGDKDLSRGTSGEHKEGLMDKIKHTFGSASHNKEGGA